MVKKQEEKEIDGEATVNLKHYEQREKLDKLIEEREKIDKVIERIHN